MSQMEIIKREEPKNVIFSSFTSEATLPAIMSLVEKDLSEPYSVFTYRYFVLGWPELTILAHEESDGKLLGVIVCKVDRQNRRKRLRGYIAMLAVEKDHRKRGIGSYLAYEAIMRMKNMNCDEVVLETELSNKGALSLYERLGFTRDKRLCRYYLNGGDAFRLKLWFTSPSWDDGTAEQASDAQILSPVPPAADSTSVQASEDSKSSAVANTSDVVPADTSKSPQAQSTESKSSAKGKKGKKSG